MTVRLLDWGACHSCHMAAKRQPCFFCGVMGKSEEHFIPQWLDKIFPALEPGDVGRLMFEQGVPEIADTVTRREAHVSRAAAVPVPGFCVPCNSGWMSRLEDRVKAFAVPMIKDEGAIGLTVANQLDLATWFAKLTVVQEAMRGPVGPTSTAEERLLMSQQHRPPVTFAVRIARYSGDWRWLAWREVGVLDPSRPEETRYSCSTFVVGALIGQVVINPSKSKANPLVARGPVFEDSVSIFPFVEYMPWPPQKSIDEAALTAFARSLTIPVNGEHPLGADPKGPHDGELAG